MRICFVCLGNICRSPTAEGVFLAQVRAAGLERAVTVDSAGTADWNVGRRADSRSRAAAAQRGFALDSRARRFEAEDFANFDWVLAMDHDNRDALVALAREESDREKVRLFRSFDATAPDEAEVPDPYHGGAAGFEEVLDMCERAGRGLLDFVRRSVADRTG